MNCIEIIIGASEIIKRNFPENHIDLGKEDVNFDRKYNAFCRKSGITFSDDICGMYRKNSEIKINWAKREPMHNLFGCFETVPLDSIISMHEDIMELLDSALEYAVTDEEKKNAEKLFGTLSCMYPVAEFRSGDALCIRSDTNQIVLFEHGVFDFNDGSVNGLVIAESYDDLIEKWSKILFLENFWWETDHDRCVNSHGIDPNNSYIKDFCSRYI